MKPILDAVDEARLYLQNPAAGKAFFAILEKDSCGRKHQHCYPVQELEDVLRRHKDSSQDLWISQGLFRSAQRRLVNLRSIQLFFVDLDTYKSAWGKGRTPEELVPHILAVTREYFFEPTLILSSGRGLQLKWIFEKPIPKAALPRWKAAEKNLITRLSDYGADPKASDATRVLRVVGSTNTKNHQRCSVLWANDGQPLLYDFEYLLEFLLPKSREELKKRPPAKSAIPTTSNSSNSRIFKRINLLRFNDMKHLLLLRRRIREGFRDSFLFHMMNCAALAGLIRSASHFDHLASDIAWKIDPLWNRDPTELSTLKKKFLAHLSSQRSSRGRPLLYTFKTPRLLEELGITEPEQQEMRTLMSESARRQRRSDMRRRLRRRTGMRSRATLAKETENKAKRCQALARLGIKPKAISQTLQISLRSVYRYLRRSVPDDATSVTPSRMAKPIRAQAFEESVQQKGKSFSRVAPFVSRIDVTMNKTPFSEAQEAGTSKIKHRFPDAKLSEIREKPILKVLDDLGFYMSLDRTFRAKKAPTQRVNVTRGNITEEVLFTKNRWYSTRGKFGGYGVIDFLMKLYDRNFIEAMEEIEAALSTATCG